MHTKQIAQQAFLRHEALHSLTDYRGILSLHAYARLALISGDAELLPFVRGERTCRGSNFSNYTCGGNGTAFLLYRGKLPEAEAAVPAKRQPHSWFRVSAPPVLKSAAR